MKVPATLSRYLARNYLINMVVLLLVLLGIIYLFDTVELVRRASKRDDIPMTLVLQMGLLKLPEVGQIVLPFAVLFSAMFTFWQLNRRYELVVVRAAGFSVWQFMAPLLGVAVAAGFLHMSVINPAGALFLGKFEQLERTYLSRGDNLVTLFQEGIWLRQSQEDGYAVLHAEKISLPEWELRGMMVLYFDHDDSFRRRIDARSATLENGAWLFQDAQVHEPPSATKSMPVYTLPTLLTRQEIEESFASPETMSFWSLPGFIRTLEETGFDTTRLQIHYQTLLAQPLLFAAMVLIAAAVSIRPPRLRGTMGLVVAGVFVGFFVFFASSYLQALGASQQIPAFLAAWSAPLMCFLLGLGVMLSLEDG